MQLAVASQSPGPTGGFRLPPAVPPFSTRTYRIFTVIWLSVLLLAIVGPAMGIYYRYTAPDNNSQLVLGSRAGFGVSPADATLIRFPVGPQPAETGVRAGDDIIAIYGLPLPKVMPVSEQALAEHAEDPAYIAMGNLLYGTETSSEVPLTVRGKDGQTRVEDMTVPQQNKEHARPWIP